MTADDFRELALSLQGVIERAHMGHPDFRVSGKIFASLHSGDRFGMVKLTPEEQAEFIRTNPGMFEPSSGAWGRQGCTNVRLASADKGTARSALIVAWQNTVAAEQLGGSRPKSRKPRRSMQTSPSRRKTSRPSRKR